MKKSGLMSGDVTTYKSLFHAMLDVKDDSVSVEDMYTRYKNNGGSDKIFHILGFICIFGAYSAQHTEEVKAAMQNFPKKAQIYMEGFETEGFRVQHLEWYPL
jgi:hypothetical protein